MGETSGSFLFNSQLSLPCRKWKIGAKFQVLCFLFGFVSLVLWLCQCAVPGDVKPVSTVCSDFTWGAQGTASCEQQSFPAGQGDSLSSGMLLWPWGFFCCPQGSADHQPCRAGML